MSVSMKYIETGKPRSAYNIISIRMSILSDFLFILTSDVDTCSVGSRKGIVYCVNLM